MRHDRSRTVSQPQLFYLTGNLPIHWLWLSDGRKERKDDLLSSVSGVHMRGYSRVDGLVMLLGLNRSSIR